MIEISDVLQSVESVNGISKELDSIVEGIIEPQCKELDDYITYVKQLVDDTNTPIRDAELEDIILTIPSLLYFMGTLQENIGIREDIAKFDKTDKYNQIVTSAQGTVQAKTALADLETRNEALAIIVYQRAKRKLQTKYEIALELLQSTKKILNRRLAELELSKSSLNKSANNFN